MLTAQENQLIKYLVEKELKQFEEDESSFRQEDVAFLGEETKYDVFLRNLLKRL